MQTIYEIVSGLDVHKRTVVACRWRISNTGTVESEVCTFGTMTGDLLLLSDWLHAWGVTHVAMESTGDYWKPVYNVLEGNFELLVVNAQHVKHVPGRKTDVKDAEWLAELLSCGLLKASFIPPKPQRALRDLTRYRTTLVEERTRIVNRLQKLLETANIKLAAVATDVLGVSGRRILEALVADKLGPEAMAQLAKGRLRNKLPELEAALVGCVAQHHRYLLTQQLAHVDFLDEQIEDIGQEIVRQLEAMDLPPAPAARADGPDQQPAGLTWNKAMELADTVPGIDQRAAENIFAEMGIDLTRFPSANCLIAWGGLAPGNHQSGGKRYPSHIRPGNQGLRHIMIQVAWAASRTKDTYAAALFHRLAARRGKKRALVALARSLLESLYYMLLRGQPYADLGADYFDKRRKDSKINQLLRQIEKLGYTVQLEPVPAV